MSEQIPTSLDGFFHTKLPVVEKTVFRMGVAGSYGIDSTDIRWAAEHGANYWVWGRGFGKVTDGIRKVIKQERENHVFKLGWLGRTSIYSEGIIDTLLKLKRERKILSIGTSIHDRKRAGRLALNSKIDLFMIRYNAKHTGAEQDIFPHLPKRNPAVVSYTALAWGQLIRPLKGIIMPPWPGRGSFNGSPLSPELCYRFVLSNPNIHVVLTGPQNREQLRQNLDAIKQGPLEPDEMNWIRQYGQLVKSKKRFDYVK
jgi:hypothetical protein